jgi:hypothetical protein
MRVPQQIREFFAEGIPSVWMYSIWDTFLTVCGDCLAQDDFQNGLILRIFGFLTLEDGTDRLARNISKELPLYSP